jgi:hypothetical protein
VHDQPYRGDDEPYRGDDEHYKPLYTIPSGLFFIRNGLKLLGSALAKGSNTYLDSIINR